MREERLDNEVGKRASYRFDLMDRSMSFALLDNWTIKARMSRAGTRRHRTASSQETNENLTLRLNAQEESGRAHQRVLNPDRAGLEARSRDVTLITPFVVSRSALSQPNQIQGPGSQHTDVKSASDDGSPVGASPHGH